MEYNRKNEGERRTWREEHEKFGKFYPTNYNLDGNMEGLLNFMYWKCDCCQQGFQRVRPVPNQEDRFTEEGRNVMIKRKNQDRVVPTLQSMYRIIS